MATETKPAAMGRCPLNTAWTISMGRNSTYWPAAPSGSCRQSHQDLKHDSTLISPQYSIEHGDTPIRHPVILLRKDPSPVDQVDGIIGEREVFDNKHLVRFITDIGSVSTSNLYYAGAGIGMTLQELGLFDETCWIRLGSWTGFPWTVGSDHE